MDLLEERIIKYHTRKGMRPWCSCSYCDTKRKGTAEIMYGTQRFTRGHLVPGYLVTQPPLCSCTDGCPGKTCAAISYMKEEREAYRLSLLPPNDSLDEAIRNRNERVREQLRKKLRHKLWYLENAHRITVHESGTVSWKE